MLLLELVRKFGIEPGKKFASTKGGEWHCSCPQCGGKDRFIVQPNKQQKNCVGYYKCRQCGIHGDTIQFCVDFLNYSFEEAVVCVGAVIPEKTSYYSPSRSNRPVPSVVHEPPALWIEKASFFVNWTYKQLLKQEKWLVWLANRGLPIEAVERYKIGWNPEPVWRERADWGLKEEKKEDGLLEKLVLSKGIVIPTIEKSGPVRIKIRNTDYDKKVEGSKKYQAVTGSMKGLNLIGNLKNNVMVVVESEFDALALDFACGDIAFAVAIGGCQKDIDNVTDFLARSKKQLLICHDIDTNGAGFKMLEKWKELYPHAKAYPTPLGKDIGEAVALGLNLREWIKAGIST